MMEDVGALRQRVGRIGVGVLIAQDLAVAPMLIVLGGMTGEGFDFLVILELLLTVGLLVLLIRYLARDRKLNLPFAKLVLGRVDLRPVAALAWCFAAAPSPAWSVFPPSSVRSSLALSSAVAISATRYSKRPSRSRVSC